MSGFQIKTEVDIHDVDYNGVARTSSIMRYIQSAAQSQLTESGMSYDDLRARSRAFILSRFSLEIVKPLYAYNPIIATSYPVESHGFSFLRCYELESDGETVARAISAWALIDTDDRSLVKVKDFNLGLPTLPPLPLTLSRISVPADAIEIGKYGVHYGDVDQNMHMNNTRYPDMYSNFLPLKNKMITRINISYLNEAAIGDKLQIMRACKDDIFYFRTVRGDGKINSEAEIQLTDL
jgi:acyl-ACP thioesterase